MYTILHLFISGHSHPDPQHSLPDVNEPVAATQERQSHDQLLYDYQRGLTMADQRDNITVSSESAATSMQTSVQDSVTSALPPIVKPSQRHKEKKKKKHQAKTASHQHDVSSGIYQISGGQTFDSGGGDMDQHRHRSESTTKLIASEEEADDMTATSVSRQQSSAVNTMSRSYKVRIDSRDVSRTQQSYVEPVSEYNSFVLK